MRMGLLAAGIGAALAVGVSSAGAAQIDVKYLLSSSNVIIGSGVPLGPDGKGSMTVRYSATGPAPGTILTGPAQVLSFNLFRPLSFTEPFYGALLTGFNLTLQPNPAPATLSAGGQLMSIFAATSANMVHCNGTPACTSLFNLLGVTATASVPLFNQQPQSGTATWTGAPTALNFRGSFFFQGLPYRLTITGEEISRTFVPEPSPSLLLAGPLLLLAAATVLSRRRPR